MAQIIWTKIALEDIQSIYDYIARDSIFYAEKYIDKIVDRVDILLENENLGRIVPEFENFKLRELIEGNYRIIYHLSESDIIAILRVHHPARLLIVH